MQKRWLACAVALAACGPSKGPSTVGNASGPRTCPPASAVYPGLGAAGEDYAWSVEGSRAQVGDDAWVFLAGKPCAAKVVAVEGATARIAGCSPIADEAGSEDIGWYSGWVVLGAGSPEGCEYRGVALVSQRRLGDEGGFTEEGGAVPEAIAAAVPAPAGASPGCETLWNVTEVSAGGVDAYDVVYTWVQPQGDDVCEWPSEDHHGVYVGHGGAVQLVPLGKAIEGIEMTTALDGILHDAGGARVLLTTANYLYGVHELVDGAIGDGRVEAYRWNDFNEEDMDWYSMAAYCGP